MSLFDSIPAQLQPQTISALTADIKSLLEAQFASVCVIGEIGSLSFAGSGHVYFDLKDKNAKIPSVMWRLTAQRHRYAIKEGTEVVVCGKLTVYPPQGKYQLTIDSLYQKGVGDQDQALRKLREKLHRLGYFAPERKKAVPAMPRRIALVTSTGGAAIRDMLEIILRRWPCAELWVHGVRVQGAGAAQEIAAAVRRLNELSDIDVILLGRGGGSSEDLAAFNEEVVAEAIFASTIPVVSAVGHEIDVTIADLVADRRAATPSEAAEIATPNRVELLEALESRRQRLHQLLTHNFRQCEQRLISLMQRRVFQNPLERLHDQERRCDDWDERLKMSMQSRLQRMRQRLEAVAGKLDSLSPLNVLARGYSLTRTIPGKHVIRSIDQAAVGDTVEIILAEGHLEAEVTARKPKGED
jgi:exodeoxyribonuclease VII large subunit